MSLRGETLQPPLNKDERSCKTCGIALRKQQRQSRQRRFCSSSCANKSRSRPQKQCCVCGRLRVNRRSGATCSAACGYEMRKRRSRKPKQCAECAAEFWPLLKPGAANKFCGRPCYWKSVARTVKIREVKCSECGRVFARRTEFLARSKKSFCDLECAKKHMRGANSPLYRGESDPNRGGEWRRLAETIRVRDGHRCQRCNRTQAENGQRLSVDHIIPWRAFEDKSKANDPSNLASLCRRCHSTKTGVYERLWLRGDRIGMEQYRAALKLPSLAAALRDGT